MDYESGDAERERDSEPNCPSVCNSLTLSTSPEYTLHYSTVFSSQAFPPLSAFLCPPDLMICPLSPWLELRVSDGEGHTLLHSQHIDLCFLSSCSSLKWRMCLFLAQHPKHIKDILLPEPGSI